MKHIATLAVFAWLAASSLAADRPNILFLMADDWSYPHAGALGDAVVKTPSFDRVAREGVLFDNAFVSSPSCTPSRHSIVSGQYPWRLKEGADLGGSLRKQVQAYPSLLAASGYVTGFSRKGARQRGQIYRKNDPFGAPFDSFDSFYAKREMGTPFCFWFGASEPQRPYEWQSGMRSGMDLNGILVPEALPDNETTRTDIADYYLRVQRFDQDAGRMIALLERNGELENTIIAISGDNGMPFPRSKATLYDLGTRVPLAIRWGAKVKGGRTVEDFVSLCDLAPTFLEAAGLKPGPMMTGSSLLPILLSEKSGQVEVARTHVITGMEKHVYANPSRALRNAGFLYIRNFEPENWRTGETEGKEPLYDFSIDPWPIEEGAFSYNIDPSPTKQWMRQHRNDPASQRIFSPRPEEELYDLKTDPSQLKNLAGDASYRQKLADLQQRLDAELTATRDPRSNTDGHEVRSIRGWTVLIDNRLLERWKEETERAMQLLGEQLRFVVEHIPAQAVTHLRRVPLWFTPGYLAIPPRAEYHPEGSWLRSNRRNPAMAKGIEFSNVRMFEEETVRMPQFVFHELAHAYHDQILGFDEPSVMAAFKKAEKSGSYDAVERFTGKETRVEKAYAMTNEKEYFAEVSEAYFGKNDFYPFNRAELEKHDPDACVVLERVWGAGEVLPRQ